MFCENEERQGRALSERLVALTINSQPSALFSGDTSAVAPPVPIPNTEVKRCSPDGSATLGCARVGRRQNPATCFKWRGFSLLGGTRASRVGLRGSPRRESSF